MTKGHTSEEAVTVVREIYLQTVIATSICSKVMEHVIYSNVMSHLELHNIAINTSTIGFCKRFC